MGLWDKFQAFLQSEKVDLNQRFELLGEGFLGTMSKFHKAWDRKHNRVVGLKICDSDKTAFFESRFKGLNKPSEGAIAASRSGRDLGAGELLALQAGVYRYSEAVDLAAKLVDRASSGVKTVLQGQ